VRLDMRLYCRLSATPGRPHMPDWGASAIRDNRLG
jgi:hypothetical protein